MKFLLATDSFKGCLGSAEVESALSAALVSKGHDVVSLPVSDGGDGMLTAFASALGARMEPVRVHDPLMRIVDAHYAISPSGTAVIETAQACGLCRLAPEERNPMVATTYGVGEMIAHALLNGCREFIIGLGGSATSDAGVGMIHGIIDRLSPGTTFDSLKATRLAGSAFTLASDVRNPLCGPSGAAAVFAPQKGADADMVTRLDLRAKRFAEASARHFGYDRSCLPGAGAAGGLGYAFLQYFDAAMEPGADLLFRLLRFDDLIAEADVVITGEGSADAQTLMGKLPERVLSAARRAGKPVWLVSGQCHDADRLLAAGFARVEAITPQGQDLAEAIRPEVAKENLERWAEKI